MTVLAQTTMLGVRATKCVASKAHSPTPLRFVWHHVQPHEAGGPTTPANLIELCDSCHYSIHRLLWEMAQNLPLEKPPRAAQLAFARKGYDACAAAGTVDKIPNEG